VSAPLPVVVLFAILTLGSAPLVSRGGVDRSPPGGGGPTHSAATCSPSPYPTLLAATCEDAGWLRWQRTVRLAGEEERGRDPIRSLRLPKERAERLRGLLDRVRKENGKLRERLESQRKDLYKEYRSYRLDSNRCRRLMGEVRGTQDQLLELHHRFQEDLRTHLTSSEFERLQKKWEEDRRRGDDDE
jgi:hypothetical protein